MRTKLSESNSITVRFATEAIILMHLMRFLILHNFIDKEHSAINFKIVAQISIIRGKRNHSRAKNMAPAVTICKSINMFLPFSFFRLHICSENAIVIFLTDPFIFEQNILRYHSHSFICISTFSMFYCQVNSLSSSLHD